MLSVRQVASLVAGFTVMLVQGSLYVYGAMTPYILSYLHYQGQTSITISDLSIVISMSVIFTNVGMFLGNFEKLKLSNKVTALVGVVGIALCTFLVSFCKSFALYLVIYGIVYGTFIGFGYLASMKNCFEHLPSRKGLCSGACLTGFGLGAFFFNFILTALVNPQNIKPDQKSKLFPEYIANHLPFALRILAATYLGVGLVGVLLTNPPKRTQHQTEIETNPLLSLQSRADQVDSLPHYSCKAIAVARTKKQLYLTLILTLSVPFGMFVAFNFKQFGLQHIEDDHFLSIIGSMGSVCNGALRLFWGNMMDVYSYRANISVILAVFLVSCSSIYWAARSKIVYAILIPVTQGFFGGVFSIYPPQTIKILGKKLGSKLYYLTFLGFSIGSVIQYIIHKVLVDKYHERGYLYCFIAFEIMLIGSFTLAQIIKFDIHPSEVKPSKQARQEQQSILTSKESTFKNTLADP